MAMTSRQVDITPEQVSARSYVPAGMASEVAASKLIILPHDSWPGHDGPVFPAGTIELAEFLRDELPGDSRPCVPVSEEQYEEIGLYSALVIIGMVLVSSLVLPTVANVLSHFIIKKMERTSLRPQDTDVKLILIVQDKERSIEFTYEGKATALCAALQDAQKTDQIVAALEALSQESEG